MIRAAWHFPTILATLWLGVASFAADAVFAADDGKTPVVVELFTSQGCSSCPAADAFLGELAERDDIIALSEHVDYWNYIGWVDPFASELNTKRQKAYKHALGAAYVYTPQMVIDGSRHAVGSDRDVVNRAIEAARSTAGTRLKVVMNTESNGRIHISIPAGAISEPATVLLVAFDRAHETKVMGGENGGRTITNFRVVRTFAEIGRYQGKALSLTLAADSLPKAFPATDGCAVLIQSDNSGAIIGAGMMWLKPAKS